jgi:4'-phosphopantetheinyl transferase EntD
MGSTSTSTEAIATALAVMLPGSVLHATGLAREDPADLLPEELALAATMKGPRRAEFLTARAFARNLICQLAPLGSVLRHPLLPDADGCTLWPTGYTGSISHSKGICTVIAASTPARPGLMPGLGIDIETLGRLSTAAHRRVCTECEAPFIEQLCTLHGISREDAITLAFSAKEAFFKYQFPTTRKWLGFHEVLIVDAQKAGKLKLCCSMLAEWQLALPVSVTYAITRQHVVTTVWNPVFSTP